MAQINLLPWREARRQELKREFLGTLALVLGLGIGLVLLADRHGLRSIGMPAISTGVFGFPLARCARVTLTEIHRYMQGGTKLERVVVCLFDDATFSTFRQELRRGFR